MVPFGTFAVFGAVGPVSASDGVTGGLPIGLAFVVGSLLMIVVWLRRGVQLRGDVLRVREWWRAVDYERASISAVEVERDRHEVAQYPVANPVLVLVNGERVSLDWLLQLGLVSAPGAESRAM